MNADARYLSGSRSVCIMTADARWPLFLLLGSNVVMWLFVIVINLNN